MSADGSVSLEAVYCLGYCYAVPAALDGEDPCAGPDLVDQLTGDAPRRDPQIPVGRGPGARRPRRIVGDGPEAWEVWAAVAPSADRDRVVHEVEASGLRGRGGAGFPAAVKWGAASEAPGDGPRYLICNGDEGDPGSFVDRLLMERDPSRARGHGPRRPGLRGDARDRLRAVGVSRAHARAARRGRRGAAGRPPRQRLARLRCRLRPRGLQGRGFLRRGRGDLTDPLDRGAARRGRGASAVSRPSTAAIGRRWSTTSRRWPPCRGSSLAVAPPTPASARRQPRNQGRLPERALPYVRAPTRSSWGPRCAASSTGSAEGFGTGSVALDPGGRPARRLHRPRRPRHAAARSRRLREVGADLGHGSLIALDEQVDRDACSTPLLGVRGERELRHLRTLPPRHPARAGLAEGTGGPSGRGLTRC